MNNLCFADEVPEPVTLASADELFDWLPADGSHIALPHDDKTATILRGRYQNTDCLYQIVTRADAIDALMTSIFRIRNVPDAVILFVGLSTLMVLVLVFSPSLRLRQRDTDTRFRLVLMSGGAALAAGMIIKVRK
jgi:hypothetical protein